MTDPNQDYRDMLCLLGSYGVEYLVIGAHAVGAYGYSRSTKDFDLWVHATPANAQRLWMALKDFGAPLHDLSEADFHQPGVVFQIGVAVRIDITTQIEGVNFAQCWPNRREAELFGIRVPVIGRADLIRNKRATGRPQDWADAEILETRHPDSSGTDKS